MYLLNLFLLIGITGILGSTLAPPLLAWAVATYKKKEKDSFHPCSYPVRDDIELDLLIPVHNEAILITNTLHSISTANKKFAQFKGKTKIYAGLDHCMDSTENQIARFIYEECVDVNCIVNQGLPGKWSMIQELIRQSDSEWVGLVDAGAIWDPELLRYAAPYFSSPNIVGIAPSYSPLNASPIERLNWFLERSIKQIESYAGGPISVHGATVFYKREYLLKALSELRGSHWINDDIVLPLTLRTLFPHHQLAYLPKTPSGKPWVIDHGVKNDPKGDFRRRKRMLSGNFQWIRTHFTKAYQSDLSVGLIATRRVFRLLWAYIVLALLIGGLAEIQNFHSVLFCALDCAVAIGLVFAIYKMRVAFWSGLQVPFHLLKTKSISLEKLWN